MVNSETTFKEFIQYIPTYYRDFNLKSLVSEICQSYRGMVALVNGDRVPQGIIYSGNLLSLIAKKRAREGDCWQNWDRSLLQEAMVSLTSLSERMSIGDFLASFSLQNQKQQKDYFIKDYFIVDEAGKLLGILDTAKLLEKLWSDEMAEQPKTLSVAQLSYAVTVNQKQAPNSQGSSVNSRQNQHSRQNQPSFPDFTPEKKPEKTAVTKIKNSIKNQADFKVNNQDLYSLLTQIPLPLRVENARGEICYQNDYWHQEIKPSHNDTPTIVHDLNDRGRSAKKSSLHQKVLRRNIDRSWAKNYQTLDLTPKIARHQLSNNHCPTVDNLSLVSLSSNRIEPPPASLNVSLLNSTVEQKLATKTIDSPHINCSSAWYYYRLPLDLKGDRPSYWLTVGSELPLSQDLATDNYWQQQSKLKQLQDEFIINITHDLKSPLTAIIGLSSLLKEEKLGNLNQSQLRHSQMIYYSGKRLINLINDFLDLTRITAGKLELNLETIELNSTCQQIYKRVTEKLTAIAAIKQDDKTVFPELQLDIAPDAQVAIADKIYFGQILTRLLENALLLTASEQLLGIVTERWSDWLAITVWNEGGGLSEAQQNFSALEFSQYTNFLTSQEKNQELGLALAQQLAQAHGGDISLISQPNYGTEVTLLLPLKPDNFGSKAIIPLNATDEPSPNSLVLIVETSATKIVDLSEKLKTLGYHCAIARNSTEALYKARCFQPGKIVLGSSFLATSEPNIVEILQSNPETRNISLVILTDSDSPQETTEQTELQDDLGDRFIEKKQPIGLNSEYIKNFEGITAEFLGFPFNRATLAKIFTPIKSPKSDRKQNLTVLRLSLTEEIKQPIENSALDFVFENIAFSLSHHVIEADSLEQAHLLAKIWDIDVIIWDGATLEYPETYLQSFAQSNVLATIPIITLDTKSTEAANQINALAVFPCLLPANERSIQQLTQVIQIAAGFS